MKKIISIISIIIICLMLFACTTEPPKQQTNNKANNNSQNTTTQCTHDWNPATCIKAECCKKCNELRGEINPIAHENVLQPNGEDLCIHCNKKSFTTYSVKALSGIYKRLHNPFSANITSIKANEKLWKDEAYIVIYIELYADNKYAATVKETLYAYINAKTGDVLSYDMISTVENQIEIAKSNMERMKEWGDNTGYQKYKQEYQNLLGDLALLRLEESFVNTYIDQDKDCIIPLAQKESGLFNK